MAYFKRCILAVGMMNPLRIWVLLHSKSGSRYDCFASHHLDRRQDKSEPRASFKRQHYLEGSLVVRSLGNPRFQNSDIKYRDLAIGLVVL